MYFLGNRYAAVLVRGLAVLGLWTGANLNSVAGVRVHPLFSDHTVLQRDKTVSIWGTAGEGERVEVEFAGQKQTVVAHNGQWMVRLTPLHASAEGSTLRIKGPTNEVELHDVVVGEVWICSGQSNMEWPLNRSFKAEQDIADSANPRLRLFQVAKRRSDEVKLDLDYAPHHWVQADSNSVPGFSAVGYYFGRDLERSLHAQNIPVGIIHTSWGGSPAEVWMSESVLRGTPQYASEIWTNGVVDHEKWKAAAAKWNADASAAKAAGKPMPGGRPGQPWRPSELYNGMLANLMPYAIQGALWYQGESNAGRAWQYRSLFGDMIRDWRRDWEQGDFWFFAVQLAPWDKGRKREPSVIAAEVGDSDWAELRDAQNFVAQTVPNVGIAVITDVGDKDDIHPTRKAPVGERLSLLARARAYHEKVEFSGPALEQIKIQGDEIRLRFGHATGMKTRDGGPLTGFTIAGVDRKFHPATARVDGTRVIVTSPDVHQPLAVRFGWNDHPTVNLVNEAGLPASPFRTDDWPLTTDRTKK